MLGSKRILAVVPARGGSKGLPGKNLKPFLGTPLVAQVAKIIQQVPIIDKAVVSTDCPKISSVASSCGLDAPFIRPPDLSGDFVGDVDVLLHALLTMEALDSCIYDVIVMLQPTSPLRSSDEVADCLDLFNTKKCDSVWTVSPIDKKYHPLKQLSMTDEGTIELYDPNGSSVIARQQLSTTYIRNGACYVITRDLIINEKILIGSRSYPLVSTIPHISIDTAEDLQQAEQTARSLPHLYS